MPKALAPLINAVGIRWDVELRGERSEVVIMMGGGTSWVPSSRSRCDVNVRRSPSREIACSSRADDANLPRVPTPHQSTNQRFRTQAATAGRYRARASLYPH